MLDYILCFSSKGSMFTDHPEFTPNLTPKQIFKLGSFGGTYWRPIHSNVTKQNYVNQHVIYRFKMDENLLSRPDYDVEVNKYKVKVGSSLEDWEKSGWITHYDPYGWVQWYTNFYYGRRCPDDERQIKRWMNIAGPRGRFRRQLINLINAKKNKTAINDFTISPKIRQTLQHWGYVVQPDDLPL